MSTTALAIITSALEELGVIGSGETPDGADAQLCLNALNVLADAWLTEPNYAYSSALVSASLPAGTQSLTIGPSMSINTPRPVRLEPGCYVRVGGVDYPLETVTEAEYNEIALKDLSGPWPAVCYYDGGSPTGNVFFWPTGPCTVHLNVQTQASQFATLTTAYTLPPGYQRAFKYTLVEEVSGPFSASVTAIQSRNARQARRAIKRANFSVPQLGWGEPGIVGIPPIY